ncbi:carnitine operon oxidoreductase CaiA [Salmonella enterica subsp. arizonae]|nr:carnitine operon oxidoreductase CaiA [Salmonella enterica subsp. arizonae]
MDFNLNDEQELFVAGIRELMASENWEAYFAECDRDSIYPERFVKALAEMGIDSLLIPEEHGGLDAGFVTVAAVWMELGRLGAPTYVLYQLPAGSTLSCVKAPRNRSIRLWPFAAPVSRCGTRQLPSRVPVRMSGV